MIRQFNRVTPIVAITSNIKPSQIMSYFTAGMNDVLGKPFTETEVIEILDVCYISSSPSFPSADCMAR